MLAELTRMRGRALRTKDFHDCLEVLRMENRAGESATFSYPIARELLIRHRSHRKVEDVEQQLFQAMEQDGSIVQCGNKYKHKVEVRGIVMTATQVGVRKWRNSGSPDGYKTRYQVQVAPGIWVQLDHVRRRPAGAEVHIRGFIKMQMWDHRISVLHPFAEDQVTQFEMVQVAALRDCALYHKNECEPCRGGGELGWYDNRKPCPACDGMGYTKPEGAR